MKITIYKQKIALFYFEFFLKMDKNTTEYQICQ